MSQKFEEKAKLPPLQESLLLQGMRAPGKGVCVQQLVIQINRPLRPDILRGSFDALLARHAALRCSFAMDHTGGFSLQLHEHALMPMCVEDVSALEPEHQEARLQEFLHEDRARDFVPGEVPLMRVTVFRFGEHNHRIVWTSHHAILDGRSRVIALQELWSLEASLLTGRATHIDPAPDYACYLDWLNRQPSLRSRAFWKSQLEGIFEAPAMPLPISTAARTWGTCALNLDQEFTTRLRNLAAESSVTLNTLLQAAWAIFLSRHCRSDDVLFGATRACRHIEGVSAQRMVGLFINTVPVRAKPNRDVVLGDFLRTLHQQWIALREHEHTPLEMIHEWCGFQATTPMFASVVVFERGTLHDLVSPSDTSWSSELHQRTGVPLTLSAFDGASLRIELHHDGEHYGAEDAHHFLTLLRQLFISMLAGVNQTIGALSMLSPAERHRVVIGWNQTSTAFPAEARVEELFAEHVRRTPSATALMHNGRTINYGELNSQANAVAERLLAEGLEPGARVAVAMERSPELVIAMLGILKAGGAYVPLETNAPGSRAHLILKQVRPLLLLIHGADKVVWLTESLGIKLVDLSIAGDPANSIPSGKPTGRANDAAYVMYTSGSTGVPKGVIVPHRAIVRLVRDTNYCQLSPTDVIGHLSNPAFDASTFEVWGALLNGGAVSIIDSEVGLSPTELQHKIATDRITALWLTTALFNEFAREQPGTLSGLRYLLTGGEKVSPSAFAAVARACPQLRLLNGYGPTETTTFATTLQYSSSNPHEASIPIGRPIANTTVYLLDERGEPSPVGVPGEICIGGPGVALGYFDDPELTRQRFIPDPFQPGPKQRLYRSGDLGRFLADGNIEFLGRLDQQIKLRGFRIEPAEIEQALNALDTIAESTVIGRFENGTCVGLSAFVILNCPATPQAARTISSQLGATLPAYMVPERITVLDRLPINANGKVDRAALAQISDACVSAKPAATEPLTNTEMVLQAIWSDILNVSAVGLDDNFFALGGHSLRAVRCLLQIQRNFGTSLPLVTLFASPTIRQLAASIDATQSKQPLPPQTLDAPAGMEVARPATEAEQRFYDHGFHRDHPEDMIISRGLRIGGPLRIDLLEKSFALLLRRHAPLRTLFVSQQGRTMALPIPSPEFLLPTVDLSEFSPEEREIQGRAAFLENSHHPFNISEEIPLRVRLLKFAQEDHLLLIAIHHIVADGWTLDLLRRDLFIAYQALADGQEDPLPLLPITFSMIAEQEQKRDPAAFNQQLAIWQQRLALPLPTIDALFRKPHIQQAEPSEPFLHATASLSSELTQATISLARNQQTTLFLLLLSVYDLLLSRRTGNHDVMVGTVVAGRNAPGAADVIGTFAHNVPLRTDLAGCDQFAQVLRRVETTVHEALTDEGLPFGRISALVPERVPPRSNRIFDTAYAHFSEDPDASMSPEGLAISVLENPIKHTKVALTFNSSLGAERLEFSLCALAKFFAQEQIDQLLAQFVHLLGQIVADPDKPLTEYSLVTPAAKYLLQDPAAPLPIPVYEPVTAAFAKAAAMHGTAPAVIHGNQMLCYEELHLASDRLAHQLLTAGLQAGDTVAVHTPACLALPVSALGVLKAGGVLLLVDPALPLLRKQLILQEGQSHFLLEVVKDAPLDVSGRKCVRIELDPSVLSLRHGTATHLLLPIMRPEDPAFIFFTSGTTGVPNAVMVAHRGLSHFITWQRTRFAIDQDARVAQLTRPSFDVILRDLFLPLTTGGICCIPEGEMDGHPGRVLAWLKDEAISVLHAVPTRAQSWLADSNAQAHGSLPALSYLFFSGEPLHDTDVQAWRSLAPHAKIINLYGPTETTLVKSCYEVPTPAPTGIQSLGQALPESQVLVLSRNLQLCGVGEPGEIVIRTPFRSLGYFNAPALQQQRFVSNPFTNDPHDLLYLTGDRGQVEADGNLQFLGRLDHQVKINGVRVEPSEVKAAMLSLTGVQTCHVLPAPGADGNLTLIAFVTPAPGVFLESTTLRLELIDRLPSACLPSAIRILSKLPINPSGKVDAEALLNLIAPTNERTNEPPKSSHEKIIAEAFSLVLNKGSIHRDDDFFELGGHSLLAMRVVARLAAHHGMPVSIRQLMTHPTPSALAAVLAQSTNSQRIDEPAEAASMTYNQGSTIHDLFSAQAARTPHGVVAVDEEGTLTFAQLEALSNDLATQLLHQGVGLETIVALLTERSRAMLVGLLGILKTGAAYLPLDPREPAERQRQLLDDSDATVIVTTEALSKSMPARAQPILVIRTDDTHAPTIPPAQNASLPTVSSHNACYIIYTSGSTGKPKGVVVEHRQVIAYHNALAARTGWKGTGCVALLQPLSVDSTVTLLFPPLWGGGTLRLISETTALDSQTLAEVFAATPIDLLKIAPSHLEALLESNVAAKLLPREILIIGGEVASEHLLNKLRELKAPCRVLNHYGPTETTVGVSTFEIKDWSNTPWPLPIGRPLAHAQFYILDPNLQPVPRGVTGDLYVGGPAVTRHYLNSPNLTARSFLPDPFSPVPGARLYCTGDKAQEMPDGNLQFLGRKDNQLKIRGRRIDPREIEVLLETHPNVKRAIVLPSKTNGAPPTLSAFLVTDQPHQLTSAEMPQFLQDRLPIALIPSRFICLEALPRTSHGKVDLKALSDLATASSEAPNSLAPNAEQTVEERLSRIWQDLLGVQVIEPGHDFFSLGGHSLLATRLLSLIQNQFGVRLPLPTILSGSTFNDMTQNISRILATSSETAGSSPTPTPANDLHPMPDALPLLPTQEGMWFLEHVQGAGAAGYHVSYIWRLKGTLNRPAFEAAWNDLVQRYEALRSSFPSQAGRPVQMIKRYEPFSIQFIDLHDTADAVRESEAVCRANEMLREPLDITTGPLLRLALIGVANDEHLFTFNAHHLVTDGWSMGVLYRELELLYTSHLNETRQPLPALSQSYADYVIEQTGYYQTDAYRRRLAAWCATFRGITNALPVPTDFTRKALQTFRGETLWQNLSPGVRERLANLARKERATQNIVFLAGLYTLLHQLTGNEQIVVGSAIAARTSHHVEQMVGCFVNTIINRGDLSGNPTFRELIHRTRLTFLDTLGHQDVPLGDIVRQLGGSRNADRSPLFQVNFTYQNAAMGSRLTLSGLAVETVIPEHKAAKFDLSFSVLENADLPSLAINYNGELFRRETAERLLNRFANLLETVAADPDTPLWKLFPPQPEPLGTGISIVPRNLCLHQLIEAQVARTPDALAVAMGEDQLTYEQLDRASNALAHRLLALGVKAESIVAVYLTRSVEAIVTLVGILKAGAAYLPLDLADPPPRLAHAISDSQACILISERVLEDRLKLPGMTTLWIDDEWNALCESSPSRPVVPVNPKSLAGLFYTSGSTGKPKGVAVQHDNLVNFAVSFAHRQQLQSTDRVAQLTALSFDVSGEEIWPALIAGSSVHVGCEALKAIPENLLQWLNTRQITICDLATPLAEVSMDEQLPRVTTLRLLITGGDRLRKWPTRPLPCKFINGYGPTETTIFSTNAELTVNPHNGSMPSIGQALENQQVYLLDDQLEPVPMGAQGEIFIGGAGVTRGYFRNPAATAAKFIPDPFSKDPGARLYRTGDLARLLPNGDIDFIGRIDNQIQIRGFRVELGEIEAALAAHPAVSLGAVTIQEDDTGTPVIIAHAVVKPGEVIGFVPLREFLSQRLPGHMLPSRLAVHEQFPLTASGKILRSALPAVDLALRHVDSDYVQPISETEQALALYFCTLLGATRVGLDDDFFYLGGHSLLIIQLLSHLKEHYGLELPIGEFYDHATVRGLARIIGSRSVPMPPPPAPKAVAIDDSYRKTERRPLLSLFATRKLPPVDAAFVGYFQSSLYTSTGLTKRQIVEDWYDGMPTFRTVRQTFMGTTGGIFLPRFENDLYEEPERLVEQLVECLELAGSIGARVVSLTGLIPSATAYGESLAAAIAGRDDLPRITTGHATTGCTVALSMKRILEASRQDLTQECLGFLGLGSIGLASLELILDVFPHPAEIILCDLFMKRPLLEATSSRLREEFGFKGRIDILESKAGHVPEEFYRARVIVGATNVPGILKVELLQPGTVIVDDSAPHCFDSEAAMARIREKGDLLVTEGGLLKLPEPAPMIIYRPEFIENALRSARLEQAFYPDEITGCVLSALLNAADPSLPLIIGSVPLEASRMHYRKLEELGFQPAELRCLGQSIDTSSILAYQKRFGQ